MPSSSRTSGHGPSPVVGRRISHYRVIRALGEGGMGEVFLAWDETLARNVALKAIRAERRLSRHVRARFLREARVLSSLDHRGICRIHDYVEGDEADHLVLEYVEGRTVREALRGGMPRALALDLAEQLTEVLAVAHAAGVVHRDLKPENLMVTPTGGLKVLDFGLARSGAKTGGDREATSPEGPPSPPEGPPLAATLAEPVDPRAVTFDGPRERPADTAPPGNFLHTEAGAIVGSPLYMSPEQARGEPVTAATDLYAFGLLLQELLTGRPAYGKTASVGELLERAAAARTEEVEGVDADLAALLRRLLAPAPTDRPTAVEARERLRWIRGKPQRRARRAVAAGSLLALALAGFKYTLDLKAARDEALQRRNQAEDLISFMLGDLRDKLQPLGRLEILDEVGAKALEYFATIDVTALGDEDLFRRSKALRQIGEVRVAEGDLAAAMEAFRESLLLAQDLASRDPDRGEWLAGLGASHFYIGSVLWAQGDVAGSLAEFRAYLAIAERLLALAPDNPDWQLEMGYALTNLGAVYDAQGQLPAAVAAVEQSNEIKRRLVASSPDRADWVRSLANGLSWLASLRGRQGNLGEAHRQFLAELELRGNLHRRDPDDSDAQLLLSTCHGHLGQTLLAMGRVAEAAEHLEATDRLMRSLVHRDPLNRDWQRDLAIGQRDLAELRLAEGDPGAARVHLDAALPVLAELVSFDPSNSDWRGQLAETHLVNGGMPGRRAAEALAEAERALGALAPLLADAAVETRPQVLAARAHLLAGEALIARGEPAAGRERFARAPEILEPLARGASDPWTLEVWARALADLGRSGEVREVEARLAAAGYARR